ncbi:MAG: pyridoxamine 5'-phosphate oxidase family protein [Spirochaetaceae bacterium]|nr:pyridoxamine 5'-phosphate oxidase family protein [Spirochaetaceae bacterium]
MFRELLRKNKQLAQEDCIHILQNEKRGVLSLLGDNDYPYGFPMNHFYNEEDGCIYFHCGKQGHKLDAISKSNKASFCVYTQGESVANTWALTIKSVIVFGKIAKIAHQDEIRTITRKLSYKFTQDENYIQKEIDTYALDTLLLKLVPENICGKCIVEN